MNAATTIVVDNVSYGVTVIPLAAILFIYIVSAGTVPIYSASIKRYLL